MQNLFQRLKKSSSVKDLGFFLSFMAFSIHNAIRLHGKAALSTAMVSAGFQRPLYRGSSRLNTARLDLNISCWSSGRNVGFS